MTVRNKFNFTFDWGIIHSGGLFELHHSRVALIRQDETMFFPAKYSVIVTSLDNGSIEKNVLSGK